MRADDLDGVVNFRDFGGAVGAGGRRTPRGRLFRSGHHAAATPRDLAKLADLDLTLIVDLRRPAERQRDPARRPAGVRARILEHDGPLETAMAPHLDFLAMPDASTARVSEQMTAGYRGYPFDPHYVAVYRDYFAALAQTDGAVLINCHAGKDRTGFFCALTLTVLGVGEDEVFEDYLATNRHNRADDRVGELAAQFLETHGKPVSEDLLRHVMMADAAYLRAAFDAIDAAHGDVDSYLSDVLGVDIVRRDAIHSRWLD